MEITGIVDRIIYRNTENGYTVLSLCTENGDGPVTVCGTVPLASPGEQLQVEGTIKYHPKYGQQFIASHVETLAPSTLAAIESYLSGGTIRGIGPAMARLIVDKFGMDTLSVMEKQPERLLEVSGIGRKKLAMISNSFNENKSMREILLALAPYGVTVNQAYRIFKVYGDLALGKVQENPYQLIDDIDGIGFLTADAIAQRVAGFETNSAARLFAGIKYSLQDARTEYGHTYLPHDKLIIKSCGLLGVDAELLTDAVDAMLAEGSLVEQYVGEQQGIFLPYIARLEGAIAQKLIQLSEPPVANPFWDVAQYERDLHLTLSESQRVAVTQALDAGVMIITGGPGTGKTTIIKAILRLYEELQIDCLLAAPTGRAAKRMTELTGQEAFTIHRLLGAAWAAEGDELVFRKNENEPLRCGAVILDECSMIDITLIHALLKALPRGCRLVLVGDADQLPSVGPGSFFLDVLRSGAVASVRLTEVFRQSGESHIIRNAHAINRGELPDLRENKGDFFFLPYARIYFARDVVSNATYALYRLLLGG